MATRGPNYLFLISVFGVVACVTMGGLLYWNGRGPTAPVFDGPRADLQLVLWHFSHSDTLGEKIKWALATQDVTSGWASEIPEHDVILKRSADRFVSEVRQAVSAWESSLTREDIDVITESNLPSIYRKVGRYRSIPVECDRADYQNLRAHFSLPELDERAYAITQWIAQHEKPYEADYSQKRLELLRDDNYWAQKAEPESVAAHAQREMVTGWFAAGGDLMDEQNHHLLTPDRLLVKTEEPPLADGNTITTSQASSVNYDRELESAGVQPDRIYETALSYAVAAPDCILGAHPDFVRMLRSEITTERGHFLLERLVQWMGETGQANAKFADLPTDPSDPLMGSPNDAWGREYIFNRETPGVLRIYSIGDNPLSRQSEIFIGQVDLPRESRANEQGPDSDQE
jgi:hypothetical protein